MIRTLLVEDDKRLNEHITKLFQTDGMNSSSVESIEELNEILKGKETFQVIVLDRLLGPTDTKSKVAEIRQKWPRASILVLSAINTPMERTDLLNLGVDDYLGKPFLSQELLARVKALGRRYSKTPENYRQVGNTIIDLAKRVVSVGDKFDTFPAKEFLLLRLFSDDMGRVYNKGELFDVVWGGSSLAETNVVEATITNLRKRLMELGSSVSIRNMRNAGYWIEE